MTRNPNPTADLIEEFATLLSTYRDRDPDEARTTLCRLWSQLHAPGYWFKQESLVAMFKGLQFTTDGPPRPNEPTITLWRGQLLSDEPTCISWTASHSEAHAYATELSEEFHTVCISAEVPRRAVLARFEFEDEWVVDPALLTDVRVNAPFMHIGAGLVSAPTPFAAVSGMMSLVPPYGE